MSEQGALLAELRAKLALPRPETLPDRLPVSAIKQMAALFQPRQMDERHIQELKRAIAAHGELDALLVFQVGPDAVLIDGHHRVAAYELAKALEAVPVRYFAGTLEEAILEAGKANSKAKLPMSTRQRQDYAWRLVVFGTFSKRQVREASGVSDGQVAIMRRALKLLGEGAADCKNWWHAQRSAKGLENTMTDAEVDRMLEAQAQQFADRLAREFGTKLANNTGMAARVLDIYFGRRLPDLAGALRGYLPKEWGQQAEDF
jgi:ParB-like chromosome segregation protein Spo0J